jgi:hypothetical protein
VVPDRESWMELRSLVGAEPWAMKTFPFRSRGVLLPRHDRQAAALGICMYTACKPWVVSLQTAAHHLVRRTGTWFLPGSSVAFAVPGTAEEAGELVDQWERLLGRIDAVALYRRRQPSRTGLTMVAVRSGAPLAVIKVRDEGSGLGREQEALAAVDATGVTTFRAPRPLGHGSTGPWQWSAQESVFTAPHRPALTAPAGLFEEVCGALGTLGACDDDLEPSHRDLTPWNLRRDTDGQVWLFDWEDWGPSPRGGDRTYFSISSRAVGGPSVPSDLPPDAVRYYRAIVEERRRNRTPGVTLPDRLLSALDEAAPPRAAVGR